MLAIAPHKCGAIFLSAVDGGAGRTQNSPKGVPAFEERMGEARLILKRLQKNELRAGNIPTNCL